MIINRLALVVGGAFFVVLVGCSTPRTPVETLVKDWSLYMQRKYQVRPGDRLQVTVDSVPDLTQEVVVDPSGMATLLRVGEIKCRGMSLGALRTDIQRLYAKLLTEPVVGLVLLEPHEQVVYVGGELDGDAGEAIPYRPGMTLLRAILAAGNFDLTAKTSEIFLFRQTPGGKTIQYRVDYNQIYHEGKQDVPLLPNDAIYLQPSAAGDVVNFVELYIRRMLPILPGFAIPLE